MNMEIDLGQIVAFATPSGVRMGVVFQKTETLRGGINEAKYGIRYQIVGAREGYDEIDVLDDDVCDLSYRSDLSEFVRLKGGESWAKEEQARIKTEKEAPAAVAAQPEPIIPF